jgi:hypothetical protein
MHTAPQYISKLATRLAKRIVSRSLRNEGGGLSWHGLTLVGSYSSLALYAHVLLGDKH